MEAVDYSETFVPTLIHPENGGGTFHLNVRKSSTLKLEAVDYSETLVPTLSHPEDGGSGLLRNVSTDAHPP
jgi:hypothetical protein